MSKTALLFGIHMHQPVDNFDWVIEHAIAVCYKPFFEVMSRYPSFRFSVHCSGWLMEQIELRDPKLYKQIQKLSKAGSIEFFSAGYYEPILSVIPSRDRLAQINRLNDSISSRFKQTPKGLWLTERVWESALIPDLVKGGIEYTVMDDYHFQCAGFDEAILDGYYLSEEGGEQIALFPISKKLRYAVPFMRVEKALDAIKSYTREKNSAAIIFDDAEKFGMWPGTYTWVYEKGWLEKFVEAVLADETIETRHFGEYYRAEKPRGITYLPNVSYYEMGEWSLRADDAHALERFKQEMGFDRYEREGVKFLKGGIWKNFFVKYPESNRIHKRMLELSAQREGINREDFDNALYKLQTNDSLWHGVFGGLYLPNLRDTSYHYLIECENIRYGSCNSIESYNNELDGYEKIKVITPELIWRFDSGCGGQLVELDIRESCFNYQNTLTRRRESYHQRVLEPILHESLCEDETPAEDGIDTIHTAMAEIDDSLRDAIIYDWYLKNSFIDHISDESFNVNRFRHCNFTEYGDFTNQPFETQFDQNKITFSRQGGLYFPEKSDASLEKNYTLKPNGVDFEIKFSGERVGQLLYCLEHNFHFSDADEVWINGMAVLEEGEIESCERIELRDAVLGKMITFNLDQPCTLRYFKLKTLSQSEQGFDLTVQGISLAMSIRFESAFSLKGSMEITNV
ncbi:alpha-amylase/4-alpha-glucanotransferase domain-containing protein [Sulfuricurvum sp.]|uniref:alpha-amylase/4-alpha-glucanotransferase domain-containing protein n=1 Tax=Sulfuricurvum sp. TaxID=2025608 RepID=UPI0035656873